MRRSSLLLVALIAGSVLSVTAADKPKTVAEALTVAADKSSPTTDGAAPFHLKVKISEPGQPDSDFIGSVDLLWGGPKKWRRTIESPDFSQTVVQNGDSHQEVDKGDYYPLWLRNLVLASTDLPTALAPFRQMLSSVPFEVHGANNCSRVQTRVGIAPAENNVFTVICFTSDGLLESVASPGFHSEFKDYRNFAGKKVPRRISEYLEPGVNVVAEITDLELLTAPDDAPFAIPDAAAAEKPLQYVRITEGTARQLNKDVPEIIWPPIRAGKTEGVLSIYVVTDRQGHVRETYPLNSDNPALDDAVRQQVSKWQLKPATSNGVPVQIETILTFAIASRIENPPAVLTDAEARKQAITAPEPRFPSGIAPPGTQFTLRISVNEQGKVAGVENLGKANIQLVLAANAALHEWRFRPYLRDGKPDIFKADILFRVP